MAAVAITAIIVAVVVGVITYYLVPKGGIVTTTVTSVVPKTVTKTATVTKTVGAAATVTVTKTVVKSVTTTQTVTTTVTPTPKPKKKFRVAILFDVGGRGDLSFNDMAWLGAERAAKELGVEVTYLTPKSLADMKPLLAKLAKSRKYDLLVLIGFLWTTPLNETADKFPYQKFALIDATTGVVRPNEVDILFREQECASLIGIIAAGMAYELGGNTVAALAGMVLMLLTGVVSTVIAVIITGMVMVLGGCLNAEQVYRAISWESVVLIAAMLPMSTALQQTGGAEFIADGFLNTLGTMGPIALLIGMFLLTTSLTQVISNTATTVLVAPIAIETATSLNISPYAMMMMVAVGASTAFLTPIASPVNTLVLTPGGYRFSDFSKVGFPLLIIIMVVSAVLVPLIWN